MKTKNYKNVQKFEDIPNIGPAMVKDFKLLGLTTPLDLQKKKPFELYKKICKITNSRHDPCVLDTYMAAVDFMNGAKAKSWWQYTQERKRLYPELSK